MSSICEEDDEGAGNDSIAALEALMTIKRSSIHFSECFSSKSRKQSIETTRTSLDSTPNTANKNPRRELYLPSSTADQSAVNQTAVPLHLTATAISRKETTLKSLPITSISSFDTHRRVSDKTSKSPHSRRKKNKVLSILEQRPETDLSALDNDGEFSPLTDPLIETEKINEALKSKPQRGKKRENLNAFERLELTRTRNREHAKSTRIRKKARYEELIDRETMYFQQQREKERDEARRRNLVVFMDLRSKLFLRSSLCTSASLQDKDEGNRKLSSSSRIVSSVNLLPEIQSPLPATSSNMMNIHHVSYFEDILDNIHHFKFDHFRDDTHAYRGLEAVEWTDRIMMNRFQVASSNDVDTSFLHYRVVGGEQGIGINQQGSAYAEFDLVCTQKLMDTHSAKHDTPTGGSFPTKDYVLLSGMLQAEFSNESDKIISVKVFSLSENGANVNREPDPKALHNAFPSVVSMDNQGVHSTSHGLESTHITVHTDLCPKPDIENASGGDSEYYII